MRYALWFGCILSDLLLLFAIIAVVIYGLSNPFVWIIVPLAIGAWNESGGLSAWRRKDVKLFLDCTKKSGL